MIKKTISTNQVIWGILERNIFGSFDTKISGANENHWLVFFSVEAQKQDILFGVIVSQKNVCLARLTIFLVKLLSSVYLETIVRFLTQTAD